MRKFIFLIVAAAIIAFGVFAIMYWLFGSSLTDARQTAITVGATGLTVELLRPAITKWTKQFDITAKRKTQ